MTDLLEQAKQRYMAGIPEGNDLAAAFRADVGYLLSLLPASHTHEWEQVTTDGEYEQLICRCMETMRRRVSSPADEVTK